MNMGSEEVNLQVYAYWIGSWYESVYAQLTDEDRVLVDNFMALQEGKDETAAITEFFNDLFYRIPSTEAATLHSEAGGTSYSYYWNHPSTIPDRGACHASELAYVFHNFDETMFCGEVDKELADKMCTAWANFARYGDPSIDGYAWQPYTPSKRETMIITLAIGAGGLNFRVRDDSVTTERSLTMLPRFEQFSADPEYFFRGICPESPRGKAMTFGIHIYNPSMNLLFKIGTSIVVRRNDER